MLQKKVTVKKRKKICMKSGVFIYLFLKSDISCPVLKEINQVDSQAGVLRVACGGCGAKSPPLAARTHDLNFQRGESHG